MFFLSFLFLPLTTELQASPPTELWLTPPSLLPPESRALLSVLPVWMVLQFTQVLMWETESVLSLPYSQPLASDLSLNITHFISKYPTEYPLNSPWFNHLYCAAFQHHRSLRLLTSDLFPVLYPEWTFKKFKDNYVTFLLKNCLIPCLILTITPWN